MVIFNSYVKLPEGRSQPPTSGGEAAGRVAQDGVDAGRCAVHRQLALGGPWKFVPRPRRGVSLVSLTVKWPLFRSMWPPPVIRCYKITTPLRPL